MVRAFAALVICLPAAYCQSVASEQFEVASIKLSNATSGSSSGIKTGHGRLDAQNVTLKRCIMGAYGVGPHQISGGPDWLDSDRFEILAKADQPIDDDPALMVLLRGLLAERFKLVLHRETRPLSAFMLEVAKNGPKLEPADAGESSTNTSTSNTSALIEGNKTGMDGFAQVLARVMDQPVVNHTGLQGIFNFKLQWTPENAKPAKPADATGTEGPSIFTAIQEQLGLHLRSQKTAVEVIVIDHAEKPSEN